MNLLQNNKLVGSLAGNAHDKVQAGVPPVNELKFSLLDDVAHLGRTGQDVGGNVAEDPALVGLGVGREELGQADLALSGHEDNEIPSNGLAGSFEVVEIHPEVFVDVPVNKSSPVTCGCGYLLPRKQRNLK